MSKVFLYLIRGEGRESAGGDLEEDSEVAALAQLHHDAHHLRPHIQNTVSFDSTPFGTEDHVVWFRVSGGRAQL